MATAAEEVDLEYIFARDIVNVLVRHKVKDFQLEDTNHDHPTPFCFRIRRAVEHFVTNEFVNIYYNVTDLRPHIKDFKAMIAFQREQVLPGIRNLRDLLKHVCLMCMTSAWHLKWGELTAPEQAVQEIRRLLVDFVSKYDDPDNFWIRLRLAAPFITERPLNDSEKEVLRQMNL